VELNSESFKCLRNLEFSLVVDLEEVKEIKDLGVCFDSLLVFDKHICEKINKACMMLGIIKRNFVYISRNCALCNTL